MNWGFWSYRYFWTGFFRYHLAGRHGPGAVCLACIPPAELSVTARMAEAARGEPYIPPAPETVRDPRWPHEPCGQTLEGCPFDKDQHREFSRYLAFVEAMRARQAQPLGAGEEGRG